MNKNRILFVVVALALALSSSGCNKSKKVVAGPPPTGPVELKLKWPTGSKMVQNLDLKQNSEIRAPGMPSPIKQEIGMGQKFQMSVVNERTDGGHEIEMEFLSARMNMNMGNQTMDFNSESKTASTNPLATAMQKIVGARIRFFMDASNEVWKVEGTEELRKQLTSGDKDSSGVLNNLFTEDYFKQIMSHVKSLPPGPVEPGASWPVQLDIPMGDMGTLRTDYKYTFKSWERRDEHNCARIEFAGTMKNTPGKNSTVGKVNVSIQGGEGSGETLFDLERGAFIDSTVNQDIRMLITMPPPKRGASAAAAKPIVLTNVMHQLITVKMDPEK